MFLTWVNPLDNASESDSSAWYDGTPIPQVRAARRSDHGAYSYSDHGAYRYRVPAWYRFVSSLSARPYSHHAAIAGASACRRRVSCSTPPVARKCTTAEPLLIGAERLVGTSGEAVEGDSDVVHEERHVKSRPRDGDGSGR
jgi:hypothetical protein